MMSPLRVEIVSLPDRDNVVAEVWDGDVQIAEIYNSNGVNMAILFSSECKCDDLIIALNKANGKI